MNDKPAWAREPRQARSQRTMDAFLDAAEALLEARPYHEIAITTIIARAGSSAGAFYARFPDKQALLHALHERVAERAVETVERMLAPPPAVADDDGTRARAAARRTARQLVESLVRGHRRHRGVLRAVAIEAFRDPRFSERALRVFAALTDAGIAAMRPHAALRRRMRADGADWERDVAFALRMVVATLDQQLFIPAAAQARLAQDDAQLGAQLAEAFIRQLQLE